MALISTGAKLIWNGTLNSNTAAATYIGAGDAVDTLMGTGMVFPGLQEIGAININGAGGSYDQIEVTTLADNKHVYVDGLIADAGSNSNEISCKFLYEPVLFKAFKDILDEEANPGDKKPYAHYVISIPEGGHFKITAAISAVNLETVSTNSALTFTVGFAVREIEMSTEAYAQ
jgi:hypothetical protein